MPKNDFEITNFANFEEVIHNFGRSDDDLVKKMLIFNICRRGLMPNLIKKSWTVSTVGVLMGVAAMLKVIRQTDAIR